MKRIKFLVGIRALCDPLRDSKPRMIAPVYFFQFAFRYNVPKNVMWAAFTKEGKSTLGGYSLSVVVFYCVL